MKKWLLFFITYLSLFKTAMADSPSLEYAQDAFESAVVSLEPIQVLFTASELLKYTPCNPEVHFEKAHALTKLGRYDEALKSYDLAFKYKYRHRGLFYLYKGECLEKIGRLEDALATYKRSIQLDRGRYREYFAKDRVLMKLGKLGADAQKIVYLEERFTYAIIGIEWKEILELSDELLKYKPYYPVVHFERARALSGLHRYDEALISYDLAFKYGYRYLGRFFGEKGAALKALDRLEEALAAFNLSIYYGLDNRWVHDNQASVLFRLDRLGNSN